MNLQKKLASIGIEPTQKIDNETVRNLSYLVTEVLTKSFPNIYDEYNNILIRLLNCNMYWAKITKRISKVNYIYEDNSIYFSEELDLNELNEQIIHECIHYLQDYRNIKGKLEKIGLCNFEEFTIYGLGLNEAAVQYMSAKCMKNTSVTMEKYGVRIKTISPNYYPFLTNLIEQIVYLIGEDILVKGTLSGNDEFEEYLLNTFESNTKKVIHRFDEMIEINNSINLEQDKEKNQILQAGLANLYIETQNMIFYTFFERICPKLTTIQEVDYYTDKAIDYKNMMGIVMEERFSVDGFYDVTLNEIKSKMNKRLYEINKHRGENTLSIISGGRIMRFINKIVSYFMA